jgi:cytoskeletal protein CcmA (bactofilin family)
MKHLYILLVGLIIYYIISRFYEKYTENFDPSLVPVSSIVTLAKVAQKLVDGNGTLTNPGNLTIGTPDAKGNLIVTGTTKLDGNTTIGNSLDVTGTATVKGNAKISGLLQANNDVEIDNNLKVGKKLDVTGALDVVTTAKIGGTLEIVGATFPKSPIYSSSFGYFTDTLGIIHPGQSYQTFSTKTTGPGTIDFGADVLNFVTSNHGEGTSIGVKGNLNVTGTSTLTGPTNVTNNLNVTGTTTVTGDVNITGQLNIVPKGSIMMWHGDKIPAGWAICNGQTVNGTVTPNMVGYIPIGGNGNSAPSEIVSGNGFAATNWGDGTNSRRIPVYYINYIMKI